MSLQARLQTATADYQKLQTDLSTTIETRQRLEVQLSENDLVKKVSISIALNDVNDVITIIAGICSFDTRQHCLQANRPRIGEARPIGCEKQCRNAADIH